MLGCNMFHVQAIGRGKIIDILVYLWLAASGDPHTQLMLRQQPELRHFEAVLANYFQVSSGPIPIVGQKVR